MIRWVSKGLVEIHCESGIELVLKMHVVFFLMTQDASGISVLQKGLGLLFINGHH